MAKKVKMFRVDKVVTPVTVDPDDVVSMAEASRVSGLTISTVSRKMDVGELPSFQFTESDFGGARLQRFTSREAVMQLAKEERGGDEPASNASSPQYGIHRENSPVLAN